MLQIVIYKKLNFWEEYTPLLMPHSNKVLCSRGKRTKDKYKDRYYSETTTHTKTGTKRGGDCANSCHTPTKYCAIEGKRQRQIQRQIQRNVNVPQTKKVLLVNKDKDRVFFLTAPPPKKER